ncbi:MAG: Stp1/IreP family PP2C-type Ser/Thr phosphatase, partial [Chloroflexota bacterium]|nr:Stp1/IreP family PP2C-type Ser/Thr phosphatase [Chloroflexota bacterium]
MPVDGDSTGSVTRLDYGAATDVGRVREANEDAMLTLEPTDGHLLVAVADGMGGHKAGEVASALAVEALRMTITTADSSADAEELLARAVQQANRSIWEAAARDSDKEGMGTTLVCALVAGDGSAAIANVGDSRAYAVADGRASLVTIDHTWVNEQVIDGLMSEREARQSPYRNLLTRSLGNAPRVQVDLFRGLRLGRGDALVLVSDGVTTYLDEADVSAILRQSATAQEAAEQLVREAVARGGADNATA